MSFNLSFRNTGTKEISANRLRIVIDVHDHASLVDDNVCRVCPALIATNDGGATPGNSYIKIQKTAIYLYMNVKTMRMF